MLDFLVYEPLDRPDVEVLVDGEWHPGEARMRTTYRDGTHRYDIAWHKEGQTFLDGFPSESVRLDTVDRARGR